MPVSATEWLVKLFPLRIHFGDDQQKAQLLSSLPVAEQALLKGCDCLLAKQRGQLKGVVFFRYHYTIQAGTFLRVEQVCILAANRGLSIEEKLLAYLTQIASKQGLQLERVNREGFK